MSNVLYPLGLIKQITVTPTKPVLVDGFDSGGEASRAIWPARMFKRQVQFDHAPLTDSEFATLLSFVEDRDASYDPFWFRDNVNRRGNILARFDEGCTYVKKAKPTEVSIKLHEVSATLALPGPAQVGAAAGLSGSGPRQGPYFWMDANRERYVLHNGVVSLESALHDAALGLFSPFGVEFDLTSPSGYKFSPDNIVQAFQSYNLCGLGSSIYWQSSANLQPDVIGSADTTLFCFANNGAQTSKVLFGFGVASTSLGMGIQLTAGGSYAPWLGGSETWTAAVQANSPINTWRSIAVVSAASSNSVSLYVNGALVGTDTNTRGNLNGPVAMGAAPGGGGAFGFPGTGDYLNHAMYLRRACTLAQIKALHNLFCAQYGVASV